MKYLHHKAKARQAQIRSLEATTRALPALIADLPLLERRVLIGWFYEGRSLDELADELWQPIATIRAAVESGIWLLHQEMVTRQLIEVATPMSPDRADLDSDLARPPRQLPKDPAAK